MRHLPGGYAAQGEGRGRRAERERSAPAHARTGATLHPSHPARAGRRAPAAPAPGPPPAGSGVATGERAPSETPGLATTSLSRPWRAHDALPEPAGPSWRRPRSLQCSFSAGTRLGPLRTRDPSLPPGVRSVPGSAGRAWGSRGRSSSKRGRRQRAPRDRPTKPGGGAGLFSAP